MNWQLGLISMSYQRLKKHVNLQQSARNFPRALLYRSVSERNPLVVLKSSGRNYRGNLRGYLCNLSHVKKCSHIVLVLSKWFVAIVWICSTDSRSRFVWLFFFTAYFCFILKNHACKSLYFTSFQRVY